MHTSISTDRWSKTQKIFFRIFFLYILILCIPTYPGFYKHLFNLKFSEITYHDFQSIVAFWPPQIILIESEEGVFGLFNYINLFLVLILSVLGGLIWSYFDKHTLNYSKLYYWIRVLARYRLAYGMIGWGLKKAFPMQMVYPTQGMLNTPFIDFAEKKLYWSHVGVSFNYTVFLGFAEILPGLLLLYRKTSVLGAALAAVVTFNICIANHAYDAGVAVPAAYFTILGIFIAWYDLPKIWTLLYKEKEVLPYSYQPQFNSSLQKGLVFSSKFIFNFIFVVLASVAWGYGFFNGNNYNIPSTKGLNEIKGIYNVSEFKRNGRVLPYSPYDSIRWRDAIFEEWSTLSYSTNRKANVDRMIGYSPLRVKGDKKNKNLNQVNTQDSERLRKQKKNRDLGVTRWEVGGMAGDRRYFFYKADTVTHVLYLQNKNKNHQDEKQILKYNRISPTRILLSGRNEFNDSIDVVLDKIPKKYPLVEGRQTNIKAF